MGGGENALPVSRAFACTIFATASRALALAHRSGLPIHRQAAGQFSGGDNGALAHLDADPLRRAVDTIGATISAAMDGGKCGNVVPMKKAGDAA